MARVPNIKRIKKEDFNSSQQDMIEKLAFPLNSFMEQVQSALNKNLNFLNLNQEVITLTVTVDSSGVPTSTTHFKSGLKTKVNGLIVINAENNTNPSIFPAGGPFITFNETSGIVQVLQVTGLPINNQFTLTVLSIGK